MSSLGSRIPYQPSDELWQLVGALCDGTLTVPQRDRLEGQLQHDAPARQFCAAYLDLHSQIMWRYREPATARSAKVRATATPVATRVSALGFLSKAATAMRRPIVGVTLAVSIAFVGYVMVLTWGMLDKEARGLRLEARGEGAPQASSLESQAFGLAPAYIVASENAKWQKQPQAGPPAASAANQPTIAKGEPLELASGVVELKLKQGVTLLIEGPAEWTIDGKNQATLTRGKLVASVPKQAIGFTVDTPTAKIVDLGTEFGVEVGPNGAADVHVLKGEVDLRSGIEPASPSKQLRAGQSARITSRGTTLVSDPVLAESFQRLANASQDRLAADPGYEVIFHYRFESGNDPAVIGQLAAEQLIGSGEQGTLHPLARVGKPRYALEEPGQHRIALELPGVGEVAGYLGSSYTDLPVDDLLFEVRLRPRTVGNSVAAYLGHPSHNGYGFLISDGKWTLMYGGLRLNRTTKVDAGKWANLAWVRQDGHAQVFVNGVACGTEFRDAPSPPQASLYIGHAPDRGEQTLDGQIAEVRLVRLTKFFKPSMLLWKTSEPTKGEHEASN